MPPEWQLQFKPDPSWGLFFTRNKLILEKSITMHKLFTDGASHSARTCPVDYCRLPDGEYGQPNTCEEKNKRGIAARKQRKLKAVIMSEFSESIFLLKTQITHNRIALHPLCRIQGEITLQACHNLSKKLKQQAIHYFNYVSNNNHTRQVL